MGRIAAQELQRLAEEWSPIVSKLLREMGEAVWPAKKIRRSLLAKPQTVLRYSVEGPEQEGSVLVWALFHTNRPSAFDARGRLSQGERRFWLIRLEAGATPLFSIEGAQTQTGIAADADGLAQALSQARQEGPKIEAFYGNKGPLSHRASAGSLK